MGVERGSAPAPRARGPERGRGLLRSLTSFLLPPACAVCRELHVPDRDGIVCAKCMARLVPLTLPLCHRCGHPRLSMSAPLPLLHVAGRAATPAPLPSCRWCERLPPFVRAVRSVCRMDQGTGGAVVHALKYGGWHAVAGPMARRMARVDLPSDVVAERTALVPLPLSPTRQRERGYNQAECLASALAPYWHVPVWPTVLHRTRDTRSQVRLTPSERATNVLRAFVASGPARGLLRGAHVVLVDDVITTGASLNAAAQALTDGGARIISYVTFGRAPDPGDRSDFDLDLDRD